MRIPSKIYDSFPEKTFSPYVNRGEELGLSSFGQLELLKGMLERGAALRIRVRGFSMGPFIRDRDVVTITPVGGRDLEVGDVVAFTASNPSHLNVHRIIAKRKNGWLVKGDNCLKPDGVVFPQSIIGRIARVERDGRDVNSGIGAGKRWIAFFSRYSGLIFLKKLWLIVNRGGRLCLVFGAIFTTLRPFLRGRGRLK